MLNITTNLNMNGSSIIKKNNEDVIVMSMNGNIENFKTININKYIKDRDLYEENKEQVDEDYIAFEAKLNEIINIINDNEEK